MLAEVDDRGELLGEPAPIGSGSTSLTITAAGPAHATIEASRITVTFGDGRTVMRATPVRILDLLQIIASPEDPRAVELAWLTRLGAAEIARVFPDGRVEAPLPLTYAESFSGGPVLAAHRGRVVVARGDEAPGGGVIALAVRRADGTLGAPLVFETATGAVPVLASDERVLLVVWSETIARVWSRVMARAFACE